MWWKVTTFSGTRGKDVSSSVLKRCWSFFFVIYSQEGENIIEEFLSKIADIQVETLTDEELNEEIEKLKSKVLVSDNLYVKDLLTK